MSEGHIGGGLPALNEKGQAYEGGHLRDESWVIVGYQLHQRAEEKREEAKKKQVKEKEGGERKK